MGTIRHFNGNRSTKTSGNIAFEIKKLEIQKKGKLPADVRYKYLLLKKKEVAMGLDEDSPKETFDKLMGKNLEIFNKKIGASMRKPSKRAKLALKEMAMNKTNKQHRMFREMVVVKRQNFHNGHINSKGKIYDVANNLVGQVNTKNGRMTLLNGWSIGKYKPRDMQTNMAIQDAINKYSPYYINLRKMQEMQMGGGAEAVVNLYGHAGSHPLYGSVEDPNKKNSDMSDFYGTAAAGPRQNIGMTAWGAMSNNAWGTFSDNAWGTVSDNAWGTASTDVWGGIGVGNLWGVKGPKIWGTGNDVNHLRKMANLVAAFLGLKVKVKGAREAKRAFMAERGSGRSSSQSVVRSSRR